MQYLKDLKQLGRKYLPKYKGIAYGNERRKHTR